MKLRKGFTLVEILVAAAILSIGIAAALSVQWNTLGGYTQARDTSQATRIGRRLLEIMKMESQQWGAQTTDVTMAVSNEAYKNASGVNSWKNPPILAQIIGSGWTLIFENPVDVRFSDAGNTRFCAFARGEQDTTENDHATVQVAVVYPKPGTEWSGGTCDGDVSTSKLDPDTDPTASGSLELSGFNAVYMANIIDRRE